METRNVSIRGVLFDFSGTLFRLKPDESWLDGAGDDLAVAEVAELVAKLIAPAGPSTNLPPELRDDWERRDLDPVAHRTAYITAMRASGMEIRPGMTERLYERFMTPESWFPYPDTVSALRAVRDAGLPVAVVSNIAWDIRPTFELHGAADLVDEYVLSFEEGAVKPDPRLFTIACERIGIRPADALMIGDSEEADGGAVAVGSRFEHVPGLDPSERPDALVKALAKRGVLV
ncbi:HAD superfamily hydrolase (TIGR01493 family) [Herbihabitans rhizosphaerae]|uniref:HAD superfamily hydrolase (TIGR01493 family) n=1 Tax=Herbihabitans rhizosphaerae TaxID=1872711 RepID=A0A4Q7KVT7_9PSEU|nr:HAD family hydrolase [Herbihabitans rhizosphaerae]RZS41149.1 HAD superfamily hydrolase (TIGR01493 family) [Herbihabitans rhizosphaerae]